MKTKGFVGLLALAVVLVLVAAPASAGKLNLKITPVAKKLRVPKDGQFHLVLVLEQPKKAKKKGKAMPPASSLEAVCNGIPCRYGNAGSYIEDRLDGTYGLYLALNETTKANELITGVYGNPARYKVILDSPPPVPLSLTVDQAYLGVGGGDVNVTIKGATGDCAAAASTSTWPDGPLGNGTWVVKVPVSSALQVMCPNGSVQTYVQVLVLEMTLAPPSVTVPEGVTECFTVGWSSNGVSCSGNWDGGESLAPSGTFVWCETGVADPDGDIYPYDDNFYVACVDPVANMASDGVTGVVTQ